MPLVHLGLSGPRRQASDSLARLFISLAGYNTVFQVAGTAKQALPSLSVRWLVVEPTQDPGGQLPPAHQALPERDPEDLADHPVARAYRDLFWSMDIDPTKRRPAGEALARRAARDGTLPRIHPLVDAYNLASAHTLVPISAFDLAQTQGSVVLALAQDDDTFDPIGGETHPVEEGRPVLCDEAGVVSLFCHRDGQRTALSDGTERALLVLAGPSALAPKVLPEALRVLEAHLEVVAWKITQGPVTVDL